MWTTNDGRVVRQVDRATISGRAVPCAYHGGERRYLADFRHGLVGLPVLPSARPAFCPDTAFVDTLPEQCSACQERLEGVYFTGQRWGEHLCLDCYEARVEAGLAKPLLEEA